MNSLPSVANVTSLLRCVINRRPGYTFPVPLRYVTWRSVWLWERWRAHGGGNAGGGVQTVQVRVYWKPCGIITAGLRLSRRPLWGGRPRAQGRGTRWVLRLLQDTGRGVLSNPGRSYTPPSWQSVSLNGGLIQLMCVLLQCLLHFLTA